MIASKLKLNLTDMVDWYFANLEKNHGVKVPKSKQKDMFIEALCRNIVTNEIADMLLFIADQQKWDEVMEKRND